MAKKLSSIKFNSDAFIRSDASSTLEGHEQFTSEVYEWNKLAEDLDRHDPFSELLIDPEYYFEKEIETSTGEKISYGIPHRPIHDQYDGLPVLPHQRGSAAEFLRKLRGFGLLADVVGSGKTFEAGIVLSELAVRGLVSTVLFIVPNQVYGAWVRTMERFFGLGKWNGTKVNPDDKEPVVLQKVGTTFNPDDFETGKDGYVRPRRPMIVTMEDFVQWKENAVVNKLFDVVIVDEAHNLNSDKGEYARAMGLLSELMKTKTRAGMSYCLLLSATPHKGNLADMFRLWYFIRCKGGEPGDFREGGKRTAAFEAEHDFYLKSICRGATTIMDFVRKEKISVVRGGDAVFCRQFRMYFSDNKEQIIAKYDKEDFDSLDSEQKDELLTKFFASLPETKTLSPEDIASAKKYVIKFYSEVALAPDIREKFTAFLEKNKVKGFDFFYEGLKEQHIDQFLRDDHETRDRVKKMVAESYHHGVLRSIMIRQPKNNVAEPASNKHAVNLMYFRTDKKLPEAGGVRTIDIEGVADGEGLRIRIDTSLIDFMTAKDAITPMKGGKPVRDALGQEIKHSLPSYIEQTCRTNAGFSYETAYSRVIRNYLKAFGLSDGDHAYDERDKEFGVRFPRSQSLAFYESQVAGSSLASGDVKYSFEPVFDRNMSDFDFKYGKLCDILDLHKSERVVIFFDYELGDDKKVAGAVFEKLIEDKRYKKRVIDTRIHTKEELEKLFGEQEDAILVAVERELTEGANFQAGSIIVNFQVTPNPLDMQQRIGRVFRIGQEHDITIYSIANLFDLEGYVLAYFTLIGLMSGNTGDAEILAGCNNDNMVSVRCPKAGCGNIELLSKEDFVSRGTITCSRCGEGVMSMISTRNVKCDDPSGRCKAIMTRAGKTSEDMYRCLSGGEGYICNNGKAGDRTYYCLKICAIAHCDRFTRGDMKGKCKALEIYQASGVRPELALACERCKYRADCEARGCVLGEGPEAIRRCSTCKSATCRPKPYSVTFDTNWEANCPSCNRHRLAPVRNSSFESYIRGLFEFTHDQGRSFCDTFQGEIDKVVDIQDILRTDHLIEED